jgi:hypothetical protein
MPECSSGCAPPSTPTLKSLKKDSCSVYVWGRNDYAQVSGQAEEIIWAPSLDPVLQGKRLVCAAGNVTHSAYVTGMQVFMWIIYPQGCLRSLQMPVTVAFVVCAVTSFVCLGVT